MRMLPLLHWRSQFNDRSCFITYITSAEVNFTAQSSHSKKWKETTQNQELLVYHNELFLYVIFREGSGKLHGILSLENPQSGRPCSREHKPFCTSKSCQHYTAWTFRFKANTNSVVLQFYYHFRKFHTPIPPNRRDFWPFIGKTEYWMVYQWSWRN